MVDLGVRTKMHRTLSGSVRGKFPPTTLGYSIGNNPRYAKDGATHCILGRSIRKPQNYCLYGNLMANDFLRK